MTLPNRAKSIHSISRQLASQYDKKRQNVETNAIAYLYQPYEPFTKEKYDELIIFTEKMLQDKKFNEVILFCEEIISLSLSGLRYYHDYYQRPLLILVTLSFLGWIAVLLKVLTEQKANAQAEASSGLNSSVHSNMSKKPLANAVFLFLCAIACYLVYGEIFNHIHTLPRYELQFLKIAIHILEFFFSAQNLPFQYYLYFLMPIVLWWYALSPLRVWIDAFKQVQSSRKLCLLWIEVLSYVLGSVAMVSVKATPC